MPEQPTHQFIEFTPSQKHNAVERLITQEFADPSLWTASRRDSGVATAHSGLGYPKHEWGEPDTSRRIIISPDQTWFAAIYGQRVVPDPEHPQDNGVKFETASLEALVKIHERLSQTVLHGEHSRTSKLVTNPDPEGGISSIENNNTWLTTIAEGNWPIMGTPKQDGTIEYEPHDFADYHTANMLLFPREVQDMIYLAAKHELAWRERFAKGEVPDKKIQLAGDDLYNDPFAGGLRGDSGHTVGIDKIDNLSDAPGYAKLLQYAMQGESSGAQIDRLKEHLTRETSSTNTQISSLTQAAKEMERMIGDVLNFNTRHETGHNTTPEAVAATFNQFLEGVARVADKLNGVYAGPDIDQPLPEVVTWQPPTHPEDARFEDIPPDADDPYDYPLAERPPSSSETPATRQGRLARLLGRLSRRE